MIKEDIVLHFAFTEIKNVDSIAKYLDNFETKYILKYKTSNSCVQIYEFCTYI